LSEDIRAFREAIIGDTDARCGRPAQSAS
jgi:hypothetical protein